MGGLTLRAVAGSAFSGARRTGHPERKVAKRLEQVVTPRRLAEVAARRIAQWWEPEFGASLDAERVALFCSLSRARCAGKRPFQLCLPSWPGDQPQIAHGGSPGVPAWV